MGESVGAKESSGRKNRRDQIVAAAELLLERDGLSAVTTRAISKAVPCSEGAIYVHFPTRLQLILTVFERRLAEMLVPLRSLEARVGERTPQENVLEAIGSLRRFHGEVAPMLCSMFAEADLLRGFQQHLSDRQRGPVGAVGRLAAYIHAEQQAGRVGSEIDAEFVAAALMAGCFFAAFHQALLGHSLEVLAPDLLVDQLLPATKGRAAETGRSQGGGL